jgi:hypothetical protein
MSLARMAGVVDALLGTVKLDLLHLLFLLDLSLLFNFHDEFVLHGSCCSC